MAAKSTMALGADAKSASAGAGAGADGSGNSALPPNPDQPWIDRLLSLQLHVQEGLWRLTVIQKMNKQPTLKLMVTPVNKLSTFFLRMDRLDDARSTAASPYNPSNTTNSSSSSSPTTVIDASVGTDVGGRGAPARSISPTLAMNPFAREKNAGTGAVEDAERWAQLCTIIQGIIATSPPNHSIEGGVTPPTLANPAGGVWAPKVSSKIVLAVHLFLAKFHTERGTCVCHSLTHSLTFALPCSVLTVFPIVTRTHAHTQTAVWTATCGCNRTSTRWTWRSASAICSTSAATKS